MPPQCTSPSAMRQSAKYGFYLSVPILICFVLLLFGCGAIPQKPLSITAALPQASVGVDYQAQVAASGGSAPYTFAVSAGRLPTGLFLNGNSGVISGSPSAAGSFAFEIMAKSAQMQAQGKQWFFLAVSKLVGTPPKISIDVQPSAVTLVSVARQQFTATLRNTPNTAVRWSASKGTISGNGLFAAPKVTTSITVHVKATSVADPSQSDKATVTVNPLAPQPPSPPPPPPPPPPPSPNPPPSSSNTADPSAIPAVKTLYAWFQQLATRPNRRLLVSEQVVVLNTNWQPKLQAIQNATGNIPVGMIGVAYGHGSCPGASWCKGSEGTYTVDSNAAAKYYWSFPNKRLTLLFGFFPSPLDLSPTGGIKGGASDTVNASDATISQMITDDGNPHNRAWRRILDAYVVGLTDLQNSGIPVIFQPFNEFDGNWHWWYYESDATFIKMWRYTFDYLTSRGVHNLLWFYNPDHDGRPGAYPGDPYVDFVGVDSFKCPSGTACSAFRGYTSLTASHPTKPFGIGGFGGNCANNSTMAASYNCFNFADLLSTIHNSNPKTVFLNIWQNEFGLQNHPKGAGAFMSDPWIIDGNNLDWP